MSSFPQGWARIALEALGSWGSGGTPSRSVPGYFGGDIPWLKIGDLTDGLISRAEESITEDGLNNSASKIVPAGTLLVAMYGSIGKLGIAAKQLATNQAIAFCIPNGEITTSEYLRYVLLASRNPLIALGQGASQQNISQQILKAFEVPVCPINEQSRIVTKLDALFEKSSSIREKLDRLPRLLANLQKAILNSAFRGDLTKKWRKNSGSSSGAFELATAIRHSHVDAGGHKKGNAADPTEGVHNLDKSELPDTWEILELREVCQPNRPICYGILKPGPQQDDGVPYIRVADFPGDQLQVSGIRKTSPAIDAQFARSRLCAGDLLMSIRGTVGRMCFIPPELEGANITQDSARLSIHQLVNPEYVRLFLKSPSAQVRMAQATKGVAIRGINIGDVRAIQIPLPERAEQDEIVRQLSEILSRINALEEVCHGAGLRLKSFESSGLAKAFRGELVPQDPTDEPASVLLERIRAQKPATGMKRGRGRKAGAQVEEPVLG